MSDTLSTLSDLSTLCTPCTPASSNNRKFEMKILFSQALQLPLAVMHVEHIAISYISNYGIVKNYKRRRSQNALIFLCLHNLTHELYTQYDSTSTVYKFK